MEIGIVISVELISKDSWDITRIQDKIEAIKDKIAEEDLNL